MFKTSLKSLVMKAVNKKIVAAQAVMDSELAEIKSNYSNERNSLWTNLFKALKDLKSKYVYNKEHCVNRHVENILNKIV